MSELFELLNAHHRAKVEEISIANMNNYIDNAKRSPIKITHGELDIDTVQVAVLLAYFGNINHCLSDANHIRFRELLNTAKSQLRAGFKTEPMTQTIAKYVRNAGGVS